MSSIPTSEIKKQLLRKGFRLQSTHHEMYWLWVGEKKTSVHTWISHGESKYEESLLRMVAKEMNLSREELDRFVSCQIDGARYLQLQVQKGKVVLLTQTPPAAAPAKRNQRRGRDRQGRR